MLMSLLVAFTVTPWASYHLLKGEYGKGGEEAFDLKKSWSYRLYDGALGGLVRRPERARLFLWLTVAAFAGSALLAVYRVVPLKLLPFDNKNELQLVIDLPRGATLEKTDEVARELGRYLTTVNEVTDYETYVGLASPMDFNGMVRHYYLRQGGHVGEIRVNLLPKEKREQQSHEIALRIRPDIEGIAQAHGARVKIVETPPGPPVLSTFVAEVYGPLDRDYQELANVTENVRNRFETIAGVKDVDDLVDEPQSKMFYRIDQKKAALHGVTVREVAETLALALGGGTAGTVHAPSERAPLEIVVRLPRAERSAVADLLALRVKGADGALIPLSELGEVQDTQVDRTIYHKNLKRLNYVTAEMVGRSPVEAVLDWWDLEEAQPLPSGYSVDLAGEGEWKITVDVFRDLGLAFGAALLMIYVLLVAQTGSLGMPLVIMVAIPLTIIGIMPGFWLLNLFAAPVGAYENPVLFTATGMIGMIALAGIVVRNSIILIDFIERLRARKEGSPLPGLTPELASRPLPPTGDKSAGLPICTAKPPEGCRTGIVQHERWEGGDPKKAAAFPDHPHLSSPVGGGTCNEASGLKMAPGEVSSQATALTSFPAGEGDVAIRDANDNLIEALIEAGATRLRPIFLTAGAAMFGSFVITLDPIFSGLAWSFIFGIFASTAFSLLVVPVVYFLLNRRAT
jgi:multidrug efflux pump subunit AcrB